MAKDAGGHGSGGKSAGGAYDDEHLKAFRAGKTVVDIGQLHPNAKNAFAKMVKSGEAIQGTSYHFPQPKKSYAAVQPRDT